MDHQRDTPGHRKLSDVEADLISDLKALEAKWNGLVDRIRALPDVDQRQAAIAVTEGESAFMRAVRAIARPERQVG